MPEYMLHGCGVPSPGLTTDTTCTPSTTSSSARARPAACSPTAFREDPDVRVLLLEAGPRDWHPFIHMPAGLAKLVGKKGVNWDYDTAPEPHLDNRTLWWPRGKGSAGRVRSMPCATSAAMPATTTTGPRRARPVGTGTTVLPYFKRSEGNARGGDALHGGDGPLSVSDLRYVNPLSRSLRRRRRAGGLPRNDDFNGLRQEGVGLYQVTQKDGARCSAAVAYLHPVRSATQPRRAHRRAGQPHHLRPGAARTASTCTVRGKAHHYEADARSAAVRRRDQFAAAAHALRHRAGGRSCGGSASPSCTTRRASARTCRTISTSARCSTPRSRSPTTASAT